MKIGEIISTLRKEKNMSQEELAKQLNVTKQFLSMIESDNRGASDNIKLKICEFFHIDMDYLFGLSNVRHRPDKEPIYIHMMKIS